MIALAEGLAGRLGRRGIAVGIGMQAVEDALVAEIDRQAADSYRRRAMRELSRRIAKLESTQAPRIEFHDVRA